MRGYAGLALLLLVCGLGGALSQEEPPPTLQSDVQIARACTVSLTKTSVAYMEL